MHSLIRCSIPLRPSELSVILLRPRGFFRSQAYTEFCATAA